MPKIKDDIVEKIKASANIVDVVEDAGIELHKSGVRYFGLCPFHADRNIGSFTVNPRMNIYMCFSCGAKGDPIKFVQEHYGKSYQEALRYLAAMYNIYIDDTPAPKVIKREPRAPLPPLQWMVWDYTLVKPYLHHTEDNVLLTWMLNLPLLPEHKRNLKNNIEWYLVGTSLKGYTQGWVIWPQVDMDLKLRDMKFMKYKTDGHRDKAHNPNWMSAMLAKVGQFNPDTHRVRRCLFGLHLAALHKDAEICLVESEKTALLCSAFTDQTKRIWMAVGGLQFLTADMLDPLIKANRYIVLFPDADGRDKWQDVMDAIGYERMSMTGAMRPVSEGGQYDPIKDGPKADIADIMIRLMSDIPETEAEKVARMLGAYDKVEVLGDLMDKLNLEIEQ